MKITLIIVLLIIILLQFVGNLILGKMVMNLQKVINGTAAFDDLIEIEKLNFEDAMEKLVKDSLKREEKLLQMQLKQQKKEKKKNKK